MASPLVTTGTGRLDVAAIALSGLCAVHCLATALLVALLASAGGLLGQPIIHEAGLVLAMAVGALALGRGWRVHRRLVPAMLGAAGLATMALGMTLHDSGYEPLVTLIGVAILGVGHWLNMHPATPRG